MLWRQPNKIFFQNFCWNFVFFWIQSPFSPAFDFCCLYMSYMDGKLWKSAKFWHQDVRVSLRHKGVRTFVDSREKSCPSTWHCLVVLFCSFIVLSKRYLTDILAPSCVVLKYGSSLLSTSRDLQIQVHCPFPFFNLRSN